MPLPFRLPLVAACAVALSTAPALGQGLAGPYLAANGADLIDDFDAAAQYYRLARRAAPDNLRVSRGLLISSVAIGDAVRVLDVAADVLAVAPGDPIAAHVLVADHIAAGRYEEAAAALEGSQAEALIGDLLRGWIAAGQGRITDAVAIFEGMQGNDALVFFGSYHRAILLALAGDLEAAEAALAGGGSPLRLDRASALFHAEILGQLDRTEEALALLDAEMGADPEADALRAALRAGETPPLAQFRTMRDGAAEAFHSLAAVIGSDRDRARVALTYARLAAHVRPDHAEALILAAETLIELDQHDLAVDAFAAVAPDDPLNLTAELGRAEALARDGRTELAIEVLTSLAEEDPSRLSVQVTLGDIHRSEQDFSRAAERYGAAIDLIPTPAAQHWPLFYYRGMAYERTDRWELAEADFRLALELSPDEPLVLNYLGYSLVEQRRNLDEAEAMIRTAVEKRPDSGFIVDSLGWVLYRLDRFEEAVEPMERAVELEPTDPVLNDHLGDVYYMVGRTREAEFQWRRALSFDPEPEDAARIRDKLERGLTEVLAEEAQEQAQAD